MSLCPIFHLVYTVHGCMIILFIVIPPHHWEEKNHSYFPFLQSLQCLKLSVDKLNLNFYNQLINDRKAPSSGVLKMMVTKMPVFSLLRQIILEFPPYYSKLIMQEWVEWHLSISSCPIFRSYLDFILSNECNSFAFLIVTNVVAFCILSFFKALYSLFLEQVIITNLTGI